MLIDVFIASIENGQISNVIIPNVMNGSPYHQEVMRFVQTMPAWKPGTSDGKPMECVVRFAVQFMDRGTVAAGPLEIYAADATPGMTEGKFDYAKVPVSPQSRQVTDALNKNLWTKAVLVCDVTASMAPYNAQVMLWIRTKIEKNDKSVLRVVLFNDGDERKDSGKKPGNVGGIYSFIPKSIDDLTANLTKAMKGGSGGDLPENNVEALIKAQKESPEAENLVMIADNPATPRDAELITQVTKPVQIIVCGFSPVLNPVWLDLARSTKGSVTFGNRSYTKLEEIQEGGKLQVGQTTFGLRNGKFDYMN